MGPTGFQPKCKSAFGLQGPGARVHHWPRDTPEPFWFAPEASCFAPKASCFAPKEQSFIIAHNRLRIIKSDQSLIIKGPRVPKGPKGPKGPRVPKGPKGVQDTKINKGQGSQKGPKGPRYQYSFISYEFYINFILKLGVHCVN